ncbi:MAG: hypothetical protein LBI44_06525 [Oscillospiraceae bacterium]|nr:hypothetical protein [Oscillospiraceae bacterium]
MITGISGASAASGSQGVLLQAHMSALGSAMSADKSLVAILLAGLEDFTRAMAASVGGVVSFGVDTYI